MGEFEAVAAGLAVHDLTAVQRDGSVSVDDVSLRVAPGELLVVVGPSGSGKTTLLRAIAGLAELRCGRVEIGDRDVTGVEPYRRNIAMVFEAGALVPFLDVAGNLGFGLKNRHVPKEEVADRVSAEARHLRLSRLLPRKPATLSAGERGRVGIGKALIRVPALWLLDEPLAHLDAAQRFELRHWLGREVKRLGVTTVLVTHDPTEALALGDRIAVLDRGQLLQVDTPQGLYQRPGSVFVADFASTAGVGVVTARLVSSGGMAGYQVGERTLPCWSPVPPELEGHVGAEVALLLRPEDVHDAATLDDPDLARLPGTVLRTEFTGRDLAVTIELDAPPATCPGVDESGLAGGRARVRARFHRSSTARPGSPVTLAVDAGRAHVFDPTTGTALWHPTEQ
ncbi:MAG TPA: ABC transporter ATP-binding protein [Actinomycetes bacterium]|nr:ABC transporter ATP-binding protein [Actinomycetes bacterium]